jgi:LacI family transcriptional regulator
MGGGTDMTSLKDIAKRCGVSTATVSKALNGQKDISDKTRDAIKQIADEMGYYPNAAARALKTNRSFNIGVLFRDDSGSNLTHEYFSGILNGFKVQAESMGYDITFINNYETQAAMTYLEHCRYRNFEGIVIVCADYNNPQVWELMCSDIPIVTIDYVHYNCTAVSSNNIKGMQSLLRYIYDKGHRRIAYIHGQNYSNVTKDRVTSFYQEMERLHLEVLDDYVLECEYLNANQAATMTRKLLSLKEPPTCILYCDDTALIGGKNVIYEKNLRIPDDISIAGYDGTKISQLVSPKTTTIRQNTDEVGREAARRLIKKIQNPKTTLVERVIIDGTLIEGQSVGKVHKE